MNRREIKERIERIKGNTEYLQKNRISEEMKRHNRELYEASEEFRGLVKEQRRLEDNALGICAKEIERLTEMLK